MWLKNSIYNRLFKFLFKYKLVFSANVWRIQATQVMWTTQLLMHQNARKLKHFLNGIHDIYNSANEVC